MKYVLVDSKDRLVHTVDLASNVGLSGARTYFRGMKRIGEKDFDKLWKVKTEAAHLKGTIERKELIQDLINKELKDDINENKTELMIKLMIMAAIYEFMFMHKTPVKVVISEYLKVSDFFVKASQKAFLNALLDKVSKVSRIKNT